MALKRGDISPDVGALQQALIEAGYSLDAAEASAQTFGDTTFAAVEDFQSRHVDALHNALVVDGVVGSGTEWALEHPGGFGASSLFKVPGWKERPDLEVDGVRQVLSAAIAEIGVKEQPDGSNAGPRVDIYQAPEHGLPWCAAFVCWCWSKTAGGRPFPRKLGVFSLYDDAKSAGKIIPAGAQPLPGDLFLILRAQGHGHCGIVVAPLEDGERIATVEGNSGNAVRGLVRPISTISAFARPLVS